MSVAATRADHGSGGWARFWPLLLPGAYLVHLAEEIWGGHGFVRWAAAHLSAAFSQPDFLLINATAWPLMFVASLAAVLRPALRWAILTVAAILLINGTLHLGATMVTGTYSPGLVSGVLLYLPLGVLAVRRVGRDLRKTTVVMAMALAVALHGLVVVVGFVLDRP